MRILQGLFSRNGDEQSLSRDVTVQDIHIFRGCRYH